jgi:hypothetical protein
MIILERYVQQVRPDRWAELQAIDRRASAVRQRLGFPPRKVWRALSGKSHGYNALIVERQWESFAQMEETLARALQDPEWQDVEAELADMAVFESNEREFWMPADLQPI